MGTQVKLTNVQINWPQLLTPEKSKKFPANAPKYGCVVILDPATHQAAIATLSEAMKAQGEVFQGKPFTLPPSWSVQPDGKIHLRATCADNRPPQVVDEAVQTVYDAGKFYPGCVCNVVVDIFPSTNYGKVCVGLLMVQFAGDGPRLDNVPKATELFQPIPVTGGAPRGAMPPMAPAPLFNPLG